MIGSVLPLSHRPLDARDYSRGAATFRTRNGIKGGAVESEHCTMDSGWRLDRCSMNLAFYTRCFWSWLSARYMRYANAFLAPSWDEAEISSNRRKRVGGGAS